MKKLTPADPETKSPDLVAENIEALKAMFPELLTEGDEGVAVNVDVLKSLVGDKTVSDSDEKYGLNWFGKRQARQIALTPSTGTLRPCPEESVDWDTTRNLMIEGDNLEVLKLLQKSYSGKVKMIYIDPPYNTGKDFVYPDNFKDNLRNYESLMGLRNESGEKISSQASYKNPQSSGRFHTDWLNMMYPRLKLARNLLRDDGVIFISIDDNEVASLRKAADEIFGEENFIANIIWQKVFSPKNSARHFSEDHDYIVVYARNSERWRPNLLPRTKEMEERYKNPDKDPRGVWMSDNLTARNYYGKGTYSVACPSGRVIDGPPSGTYWRISKEKFDILDKDNRIWWGDGGNNMPRLKRFISEVQSGKIPQTLWKFDEVGHTQEAKKELLALVKFPNSDTVFDTPKPTRLIQRILHLTSTAEENAIVLDFFAGSGTTMDALYQQNLDDNGNRRCILVQLPEPMPEGTTKELSTIADLTKVRIRNAGKKIKEANPMFAGDTGFKVFKLASTNIKEWESDRENLAQSLFDAADHLKQDRTEDDILYEILLKLGLDLTVPIETRTIATKTVHSVGAGVLLTCLATSITRDDAEKLALGIARWHRELNTEGETTVVFRDSAFADDVAKTNLAAILNQHGLTNVRSL